MTCLSKGLVFALGLLVLLTSQISNEIPVSAGSTFSISVPDDYPTIQSAIDHAAPGDSVFVSAGLYYERVTVNKTLTLVGDNWETILDGSNLGTLIRVTADNVKITGFKLQNSGWKWGRAGVEVYHADNCSIENNFVYLTCHQIRLNKSQGSTIVSNLVSAPSNPFPQSAYGIRLENCTDCLIIDNEISNNIGGIHLEGTVNCTVTKNYVTQNSQGIRLYSPCINSKIIGNTVFNNTNDGMLVALPNNTTFLQNTFYHNNFINNSQPFIGEIAGCTWDNGYEGNYWTAYQGQDNSRDGIGDTPYVFGEGQDRYPLMGRHSEYQVSHRERTYQVELICNFAVLDLHYNRTSESNSTAITLKVESKAGNTLFCRATLPAELLGRPYSVEVDGSRKPDTTLNELSRSNSTYVVLYFTHSGSAHTILLIGASAAEDQSPTLLYLVITAVLGTGLAIAVSILWRGKKRHANEHRP